MWLLSAIVLAGLAQPFLVVKLFPGGPGKTWSPEDFTSLMDDLEGRVFGRLPDDTWVYPGHGDDTTLGATPDATASFARNHERFAVSTTSIDLVAYGLVARAELAWRLWRGVTLRTGTDILLAPYRASGALPQDGGSDAPDVGSPVTTPPGEFDRSAVFFNPALYGEMDMHPSGRTQIISGVRLLSASVHRRRSTTSAGPTTWPPWHAPIGASSMP